MAFLGVVVLGYLLGSCPWGYWLVRAIKHEDIRKVGSGNIGATNVWRTYGRWLGVPVVLLDVLKGFVPAFLGVLFVSPPHLAGLAAGAAAMLGSSRRSSARSGSRPARSPGAARARRRPIFPTPQRASRSTRSLRSRPTAPTRSRPTQPSCRTTPRRSTRGGAVRTRRGRRASTRP